MTEKKVTPKIPAAAQANKAVAASKATPKKTPAAKATTPAKAVPVKAAPKAALAPKAEKKNKKEKKSASKIKVVRDSFTMPQSDYAKIGELKQLCLKTGLHVKKSELLRAGLHAISKLSVAQLTQALSSLEKIKTGRPANEQEAK